MTHIDIARLLQRRPFESFRIIVTDGAHYDVRHPEMAIVAPTTIVVGTPDPTVPGAVMRYDLVSMFHVVRIEPLPAAPATQGTGAQQA